MSNHLSTSSNINNSRPFDVLEFWIVKLERHVPRSSQLSFAPLLHRKHFRRDAATLFLLVHDANASGFFFGRRISPCLPSRSEHVYFGPLYRKLPKMYRKFDYSTSLYIRKA